MIFPAFSWLQNCDFQCLSHAHRTIRSFLAFIRDGYYTGFILSYFLVFWSIPRTQKPLIFADLVPCRRIYAALILFQQLVISSTRLDYCLVSRIFSDARPWLHQVDQTRNSTLCSDCLAIHPGVSLELRCCNHQKPVSLRYLTAHDALRNSHRRSCLGWNYASLARLTEFQPWSVHSFIARINLWYPRYLPYMPSIDCLFPGVPILFFPLIADFSAFSLLVTIYLSYFCIGIFYHFLSISPLSYLPS